MSQCYGSDCTKDVDYQLSGSFFCSAECKKNYNDRDGSYGRKSGAHTIQDVQAKLKMMGQMAAQKRQKKEADQLPSGLFS